MEGERPVKNNRGILGASYGSLLVGLSMIPLVIATIPAARANPCSGIFSEAFDNRSLPSNCTNVSQVTQPPLPEQQQPPSAQVKPVNGKVNVRLMNQSNTIVSYQVIGDTQERKLLRMSEQTLRDLKTPVTITFGRPDGGLLLVRPQATTSGMLDVTLTETTDFGTDKNAMVIQESGDVFLN